MCLDSCGLQVPRNWVLVIRNVVCSTVSVLGRSIVACTAEIPLLKLLGKMFHCVIYSLILSMRLGWKLYNTCHENCKINIPSLRGIGGCSRSSLLAEGVSLSPPSAQKKKLHIYWHVILHKYISLMANGTYTAALQIAVVLK